MTKTYTKPASPSAHLAAEVDGLSKDQIVVVGGPYPSGTVLGQNADETYTQLNTAVDGEANEAVAVLYGHCTESSPASALAHTRLCAVYDKHLTWPDGMTADLKQAAMESLAKAHIVLR